MLPNAPGRISYELLRRVGAVVATAIRGRALSRRSIAAVTAAPTAGFSAGLITVNARARKFPEGEREEDRLTRTRQTKAPSPGSGQPCGVHRFASELDRPMAARVQARADAPVDGVLCYEAAC